MRFSTAVFSLLLAFGALHHWSEPAAHVQYPPLPKPSFIAPVTTAEPHPFLPSLPPLPQWHVPGKVTLIEAEPPRPVLLEDVFSECKNADPCIVKSNPGGNIWLFKEMARRVLEGERSLVVIDGLCASACAIFADAASKRVCITPRADFQFHKAYSYKDVTVAGKTKQVVDKYFDPPHRPAILKWAARKGGFPEKGMLKMPYTDAARFWRTCELAPPLPKPRPSSKAKNRRT